MGAINDTLGQNIALFRRRAGLTQAQVADRISEAAGENVTVSTVSRWERGEVLVPAEMIYYLCSVIGCTSYQLFPHSATVNRVDIELLRAAAAMNAREKEILLHMLTTWDGDHAAFWEYGLLYFSLPRARRYHVAGAGIEEYKDARRAGDLDETAPEVNLPLIIRAQKKLEDENE